MDLGYYKMRIVLFVWTTPDYSTHLDQEHKGQRLLQNSGSRYHSARIENELFVLVNQRSQNRVGNREKNGTPAMISLFRNLSVLSVSQDTQSSFRQKMGKTRALQVAYKI
jgi:hypothetical protein